VCLTVPPAPESAIAISGQPQTVECHFAGERMAADPRRESAERQ
jgi:hypothetical protein